MFDSTDKQEGDPPMVGKSATETGGDMTRNLIPDPGAGCRGNIALEHSDALPGLGHSSLLHSSPPITSKEDPLASALFYGVGGNLEMLRRMTGYVARSA